jgi:glyoxylase-like metal-dependent hydrolase (beta-lactamase superfamily II)
MRAFLLALSLALLGGMVQADPAGLKPVDPLLCPNLFVWSDTCNVYVVRDGENAVLIDLGEGSVLEHLGEIGVRQIEWVLFTHHHREQCQGYGRLAGVKGIKVAGPEAERVLFERPDSFRKMRVSLSDPFTVHGASYVRPPIQPIHLDRGFSSMDTFTWRGREFWCVETRGNSPGGISYVLNEHGRRLAFSGDVMLAGARMHNWFDTEWDYGFAAGLYALHNSAAVLEALGPDLLLPAHGTVVRRPKEQLSDYQEKLRQLERRLLRGYDVNTFAAADQDRVSKPTAVPYLWQVTPHLFKFKGPNYFPNFALLLADSGHALVVDCGLIDKGFLDRSLNLMREHLGLKQIDAAIITHMHGDHILEAPHLREKWGAQIWALDLMKEKFEHPERFDLAAAVQAYGNGLDSVHIDRTFRSGERLDWEGYKLTVDWMPGQTEFALCLHGVIDGRKVAFTGDNIFGNPRDPKQNGHEAVVARNSAILEEGYIYGAEYLGRLHPELLIGGHSFVMDRPAGLIDRYRRWAYDMRNAFRELSPDPDYRYGFDPFWVHAEPYRVSVRRGESVDVLLSVRNFRSGKQSHQIAIHTPPGVSAEPPVLNGTVAAGSREAFPIRLKAAPDTPDGVKIVALDVTLDGHRYGEWFDFILNVEH